jgi:hypothetical protein
VAINWVFSKIKFKQFLRVILQFQENDNTGLFRFLDKDNCLHKPFRQDLPVGLYGGYILPQDNFNCTLTSC